MRFILLGSTFCFLGVVLGAIGSHTINVDNASYNNYQTAIQFHFYHALGLLAVGLTLNHCTGNPKSIRLMHISAWFLVAGILLFSGTIYLITLAGYKELAHLTPLGGLCLCLAWLVFSISLFMLKNR